MPRNKPDIRLIALRAAPAFALAISLAACGGGDNTVASEPASAPAEIAVDEAAADNTAAEESTTAAPTTSQDVEQPADTETSAAPAASTTSPIQKLSIDEAIANADVNQPNLAGADNVLDIETLAVADGSIQTLRDVVAGDRPVLLWFFSPH